MRWLRAEERADRVNARVADKLVIALPRELTLQQQITLVWSFAEKLTQGRASWFASIHAKGKDRENPHCHLLVRDRDIHTGSRVVMFSAGAKEVRERAAKGLSAPTTLRDIRVLWEQFTNQALRDAGRVERIDRRTLAEQGIGRSPQVHEGPNIRAMHERGFRPQSRERVYRNRAVRRRGVPPTRLVRYPEIDRGRTRMEYNAALRPAPRVTMEDRPKVRVGEAPRENSPFRAHPPVRPQAELRSTAFNLPEPVRATPLAVPTPPPQQQRGGFSPADAGRGPVADGAPFENQAGGAGAVCCPSFGATPRGPARRGAATAASRDTRADGGIVAVCAAPENQRGGGQTPGVQTCSGTAARHVND